MGVREAKVEKYLDSQVKKHHGITRKWVSPGRDGVPDRIVIYKGEVYFVEIKTSDGKLSYAQTREHIRLLDAGANVSTVYGDDGVDAWIREVLLATPCQFCGYKFNQDENGKYGCANCHGEGLND